MSTPTITVNRTTTLPWHAQLTVSDVIGLMHYTFPHIIVTINGSLVQHEIYDTTLVPPQADVRIIHLIAGG
ncbi:MAG: thiamine biosynthesis protein ThiS [Anaerolineae bacterium]|nr:thiamine biosynthesis protein ThiS [Anaerolineae bacterium]